MVFKSFQFKETAAFVIPHFAQKHNECHKNFLVDAIDGLFAQTDPHWRAIIIDDCSPWNEAKAYLETLKKAYFPKIDVIFLPKNMGPGFCRNVGISWAMKENCGITLFNDADDISHPERLRVVRNAFLEDPNLGLVYSTFKVIDEHNQLTLIENISTPILEILESHLSGPLEGEDAWILMGTETGYTNKTSSTAVRTFYAYSCPFPIEYASEDFHTWMRLSAHGVLFKYTPLIPTFYRIPSYMRYQASRIRIGQSNFNKIKTRVDSDGFTKATKIATARKKITPEKIPLLKVKFFQRLAQSMKREGEINLAEKILNKANAHIYESSLSKKVHYEKTNLYLRYRSFT